MYDTIEKRADRYMHTHEKYSQFELYLYFSLLFTSVLTVPLFFYLSRQKSKEAKNQRTHCRMTLWLHHLTLFNLSITMLVSIYEISYTFLGYESIWKIHHLKSEFVIYRAEINYVIVATQAFEWLSMTVIILFQKDKSHG